MTIRIPTLAAFTLTFTEGSTPQPLKILAAAIHSSRLLQALCWSLVFFL
jgi:hypothetical protein